MNRKGIKTANAKYQYSSRGKKKLKVALPDYSREVIKHITRISNGKEWIAELNMINGEIIIDDIQVSHEINHSYLHWDRDDESKNVGYIHYHPPTIIPEFSAQDFVLAMNIHELRHNKEHYPYTIMGLVYPDGDKLKTRIYAINPDETKIEEFEGLVATEKDMKDKLDRMVENKELLKLKNLSGELT